MRSNSFPALTACLFLLTARLGICQVLLYSNPLPYSTFTMVLGDVNGNGTADHVHVSVIATGSYGVDIREGGDGRLIRQIPTGPLPPTLVAAAGDIDLDGSPDLLLRVGGPAAPDLEVRSSATGMIILSIPSPAPAIFSSALAVGDTNLDGWPDLVSFVGGGGVSSHLQIRSGYDGALLQTLPDGIPFAAGDVDGDGGADVVVARRSFLVPATFAVHSGATGALLRSIAVPPAPSGAFPGLSVDSEYDFDGDGFPDACVSAIDPTDSNLGNVYVYSLATGTLLFSFSGPLANQGGVARFLGDISGDGVSEFLLLTVFTPYVIDGVDASARPIIGYPNGCTFTTNPIVGDVTHDGIGDVIIYHCQFGSPWSGYDVISPTPLQPAEQRLLGLGCGPTLALSAPPVIGTVPNLSVTGASPGMNGFLWAGPRAVIPAPLGSLCPLFLDLPSSALVTVFNADLAGTWSVAFPIPATTALIDARLTLQASLVTPGLAVTNAVYLRFGY